MKANLKIVAGVGAALLFAGSAHAAVLTATPLNYSKEGITSSGSVTLPTITAVLASNYSADDRIALTIDGATVSSATDLSADMTCNNGIIVGFLNRSGNTVNFRVNQVNVADNIGATCTISGIAVSKSSLSSATKVVGRYAAETSLGEVIDTGCATTTGQLFNCAGDPDDPDDDITPNVVTLANVFAQFTAAITKNEKPFNGVIDVETDRQSFATPDEFTGDNLDDSLSLTLRNRGNLIQAETDVAASVVIPGNFGFAAGEDGICGNGDDTGAVTSLFGDAEFAEDCSEIMVDYPGFADGVDTTWDDKIVVFTDLAESDLKLSPQTFQGSATFEYGSNDEKELPFAAGAWTINGALVFIPYMPYGDNISQIIYIANRGSQDGTILVDAFDEDGQTYTFSVGTVESNTVRKLTGDLLEKLTAAGFEPPGKVAFELTVNAPDKDIDVYSAYNVGGSDRGTVVNSQNGKALEARIVAD